MTEREREREKKKENTFPCCCSYRFFHPFASVTCARGGYSRWDSHLAGCDSRSQVKSLVPFFLPLFCVTRLNERERKRKITARVACSGHPPWWSRRFVVRPRTKTRTVFFSVLGLPECIILLFVQLTYRRPGSSGHDGGQLVRDYQHPRASRSHAPEIGEASLETDPRRAVRGRGTTFRTVSPVFASLCLASFLRLVSPCFVSPPRLSLYLRLLLFYLFVSQPFV